MRRVFVLATATAFALTGLATAGVQPAGVQLPNGDFERGNLSRWKAVERGDGFWIVYDAEDKANAKPPMDAETFGISNSPQPRGAFSLTAGQQGPGALSISRHLRIPPDATRLVVWLHWENTAGVWMSTGDFVHAGPSNQHFRIELLKPRTPPFSTNGGRVLETIFETDGSTPMGSKGWQKLTANLRPLQGRGARIRLAEVDNEGNLAVGIDDLKIKTRTPR